MSSEVVRPDAPFAVRFFDEQFRRQVREGRFELNPFEATALGHVRGDVLDLGCGLGNLAIEAARRGCRVTAVDGSRTAIERLSGAARAQGLDVRAALVDLETYAVEGSYDTVACIGVLMFFGRERARALLRALRDAVRPGGTLVVNVLVEGTTYLAMFDPDRHHLFGPREVEDALHGWEIVESRTDRFPAPGETTKVFSTVVARRPPAA